jgi:3-dehydroquinate dehydratase type I
MPPLLANHKKRISKHRPDIIKIVTTATSAQDNLTILNFLHNAVRDQKIVSFAMGEKGKISRITSPIFGAYFTIASLEDGAETAQGQPTIDDLRMVYGVIGLS